MIPLYQDTSSLVQALELPIPVATTEAPGIFQPDLIVRQAIIYALADLRANPYLLDYAFASFAQDDLTRDRKSYGESQIEYAKKWLLNTRIPVQMTTRLEEPTFPCITIEDRESVEEENTLGDVHWQTTEDLDSFVPQAQTFSAKSYVPATGQLVIPDDVDVVTSTYLVAVDALGKEWAIQSTDGAKTIYLLPGVVADFTHMQLRAPRPATKVSLESASFRSSFVIGCHVQGDPVFIYYLGSVVQFALLRYRQALLEMRGFERSRLQVQPITVDAAYDDEKQYVFTRQIVLTGYVRNYWPKVIAPKVTATAALTTPDGIQTAASLQNLDSSSIG